MSRLRDAIRAIAEINAGMVTPTAKPTRRAAGPVFNPFNAWRSLGGQVLDQDTRYRNRRNQGQQ